MSQCFTIWASGCVAVLLNMMKGTRREVRGDFLKQVELTDSAVCGVLLHATKEYASCWLYSTKSCTLMGMSEHACMGRAACQPKDITLAFLYINFTIVVQETVLHVLSSVPAGSKLHTFLRLHVTLPYLYLPTLSNRI